MYTQNFSLSYYYNLDHNVIAVYKLNPRSKTLFPVGFSAVHIRGMRREHRSVPICTSCLKAVL